MFSNELALLNWEQERKSIYAKSADDVRKVLASEIPAMGQLPFEDFKALLSPAAAPFLENMAQKSAALTRRRFGNTMQLFTPLYLSNLCSNSCTYCGFSASNRISRKTLSLEEVLDEARILKDKGFKHLLLVTGDVPRKVGLPYLAQIIRFLAQAFPQISIEVPPMEEADYQALIAEGLYGVCLYQETYNPVCYRQHHLKGSKRDMANRLNAPDKMGNQGVQKIGLGVLLGLEDWRVDSLFCGHHLRYLQQHFWKTRYSLSLPRLQPSSADFQVPKPVADRDFVQLITAWRLFDPDIDLILSTRESARLRDRLCRVGVNAMSADVRTEPGGHALGENAKRRQFEVGDHRSLNEIADMLKCQGFSPILKDWGWL